MQTEPVWNTPFGPTPKRLIREIIALTDIKYKQDLNDWILIARLTQTKKRNGKTEEIYLPRGYFNFLYALWRSNDNFDGAIAFLKAELTDVEGDPVYLPDWLMMKYPDSGFRTYTSILKEIDEDRKDKSYKY